jgi:hypothetical protein
MSCVPQDRQGAARAGERWAALDRRASGVRPEQRGLEPGCEPGQLRVLWAANTPAWRNS